MPKAKTIFFCQNCGFESSKWMGQCPACKEWNSFAEEPQTSAKKTAAGNVRKDTPQPKTLSEIEMNQAARIAAPEWGSLIECLAAALCRDLWYWSEVIRALASRRFCLQVCRNLSDAGKKVLYISGEESLQQIRLRAERIGSFTETSVDSV